MRNLKLIGIFITAALYLTGCETQRQSAGMQEPTQEETSLASQVSASSDTEFTEQEETQTDEKNNVTKSKQSDTDQTTEEDASNKENGTDNQDNICRPREEDEYKATFLGTDSRNILSCMVYHGKTREEIDLGKARGKYLLQMLSNALADPGRDFWRTAGMLDLKHASLEKTAESRPDTYFVLLESQEPVSYPFLEPCDGWTTHTSMLNSSTLIIEVGSDTLYINEKSDDTLYYPIEMGPSEDLREKWAKWEQTEDWQQAFSELEEEQEELEAKKAEAMNPPGTKPQASEGSLLGIDSSQIQACKIFHGESQQELSLTETNGQEFIHRLAAFLGERKYSDGPNGMLDFVSIDDLGNAAQKNNNDYYILLQFTQPVTVALEENPEGMIQIRNSDMLLIEVSKADKALRLLWHHPDMEGEVSFIGNIGVYGKKVYPDFSKMCEEWAAL